jgi:hypothetical protein
MGRMKIKNSRPLQQMLFAVVIAAISVVPAYRALAQTTTEAPSTIVKRIGEIKSIAGNSITITQASGPDVVAAVQPSARILRMAPGDKDLKNAAPIQLQDLHVGDTVRVRGYQTSAGLDALEVLVITSSAVDAVRDQLREDWQKRGVGGLVESVDASTGTITLSIPTLVSKRTVLVHTTKSTLIHRYSPDSAKPEEAKICTLQDVQVGDQLRARGTRSSDGGEISAEEIYTGVFPQLVGTVKSVDASGETLSVQDLATKKTVQLKVNADSQLHKIPAETAQRFAAAMKFAKSGATPNGAGATSAATSGNNSGTPARPAGGMTGAAPAGGMGGRRMGGNGMASQFQHELDKAPPVTLSDLHKGDAVAILATQGSPAGAGTVVKLFSGVEPILEAAPSASQAMMLSPWSLGGAPGGDAQ